MLELTVTPFLTHLEPSVALDPLKHVSDFHLARFTFPAIISGARSFFGVIRT